MYSTKRQTAYIIDRMKTKYIILPLLCLCTAMAAQDNHNNTHQTAHKTDGHVDTTDVFFRHLNLNEVTVTGVTGDTKLKHATAPVSIVSPQVLRATASTNIIDAISRQPGVSQLTTGGSISKPIIRGLGYNRVVVMSEGVRQEGQQWGDEHGVEVDGSSVNSVEILKGPASLMYGSDAMAGVVILHAQPTLAEGEMRANASSEYQTNNGLFAYNLSIAGNQKGFVWDARFSNKMAHAYKNKYDGYVPGSQFRERGQSIIFANGAAVADQILLSCRADFLGRAVFGERHEDTLHSGSLFHILHFEKEVQLPALLIAVKGALTCIDTSERSSRLDHIAHSFKGKEPGREHKLFPLVQDAFCRLRIGSRLPVLLDRLQKLVQRGGRLLRRKRIFLNGRREIGEPGIKFFRVIDLGDDQNDAVRSQRDRLDHERVIFGVKTALNSSLFHHIAE